MLAAIGFRVEPADAARQCAIWGTGGALRRSRKPHSDSDESTPFDIYDWSLLTTDSNPRDSTGRSRNQRKARLCWESTSWNSPGLCVGCGVCSRPGRDGDATSSRCLPLRLIFLKNTPIMSQYLGVFPWKMLKS